jgi:hypothetical protein
MVSKSDSPPERLPKNSNAFTYLTLGALLPIACDAFPDGLSLLGFLCLFTPQPATRPRMDSWTWQRYRCRCGCVSSCPFRTTALLPHPGQRTPSGQRCWRTKAKHFAPSSRDGRLTGSTVAMMTGPSCSPATADRLEPSSYPNPPLRASITPEADKSLL